MSALSADHVVAVAKRIDDIVIELVARSFGKAHQIEPVAAPSFAVVLAGQQAIDEPLVRIGLWICNKGRDFARGRREAQEVKVQPADQGSSVGFR